MISVFIVMKDYPYIYQEIERVFFSKANAEEYITDTYPYYVYYKDRDIYAMSDLEGEELDNEERYYIVEMPVMDDLPKLLP